jgi:hypothetical protein
MEEGEIFFTVWFKVIEGEALEVRQENVSWRFFAST